VKPNQLHASDFSFVASAAAAATAQVPHALAPDGDEFEHGLALHLAPDIM